MANKKPAVLLEHYLKQLKLPTMLREYQAIAATCAKEGQDHIAFLLRLAERELLDCEQRAAERRLKAARFPVLKTLDTFDFAAQPGINKPLVLELVRGDYLDVQENVLFMGNPGTGKTHLLCAIGHELIQAGRRVYFTTCSLLVQQLLRAKQDLRLERHLKRLGRYDALIIDDIGYVQHDRDEMEVLFTLFADRYERGSVLLTSNLPFSKWERIFKDPMTTAAAIDRLVHHSVILELNISSYRMEHAKTRKGKGKAE